MANRGKQLTGPFDRLTVVRQEGRYHWCTCACGTEARKYRTDHLKSGNTRSCGCLRVEAGRTVGATKRKVQANELP